MERRVPRPRRVPPRAPQGEIHIDAHKAEVRCLREQVQRLQRERKEGMVQEVSQTTHNVLRLGDKVRIKTNRFAHTLKKGTIIGFPKLKEGNEDTQMVAVRLDRWEPSINVPFGWVKRDA